MKIYEAKLGKKGITNKGLEDVLKEEIRNYCLLEGFDQRIGDRIKTVIKARKNSFKSIHSMVKTYKAIFESLGYGAEDFIQYMNSNPTNLEIPENWFKYTIALLNVISPEVMEDALFGDSYIISPKTNPIELNAVINWLTQKDSTTGEKRETSVYEIKYYMDKLCREEMGELIKKYPFTKGKISAIPSKSEILTVMRIKENKKWVKGLK